MSAHTKKHHTEHSSVIRMHHAGVLYQFPVRVAEKYRISDDSVNADDVFFDLNKKYTKAGVLLKGIRVRENLTQIEIAKYIGVTQSDISQMENGTRRIGRVIAKRLEELFGVNYRSFLE